MDISHNNKELIVIAGPTASGKTALSVELAQKLGTAILSADSRQCFKEMNIGVAKPTEEEMQGVPHYFIDAHSITEDVNAGMYEQYGLSVLEGIFSKKDKAIVVGGTGLYIKALCEGLDNMPTIDKSVRENIVAQYESNGLSWLQQQVTEHDPTYWNTTTEKENPQRLMRALEVVETTGKSILHFRSHSGKKRDFSIKKYAIEWPRQLLYERINQRVDLMITNGLVEEVRHLLPYRQLNALQTVGYTEIFDFLDNKTDLPTAIQKIKTNTRHYAKRQMTWFKRDTDIEWIQPTQFSDFIHSFTA
ncbi:MAG: tRNA (adenosine(37)-N6)-dimethylallyltransferase MiaA [Chitinophagaceae bacterium]